MQPIYVTITLLGCAMCLASAGADDSYDVDLNDKNLDYEFAFAQLRDNVFAEVGEKFHPNRVLRYLKKLHQVMTMEGHVPEDKNAREYREKLRGDVERLINVSIRTPSKCDQGSFDEIDHLMRQFGDHKYQVIPYLKYQEKLLHNYCEQVRDWHSGEDSSSEPIIDLANGNEE